MLPKRILYTGLKSPTLLEAGSHHVAFIQVEPCYSPHLKQACLALKDYTALLFTSQSAVHFFLQQFETVPTHLPTLYTVGSATANLLIKHNYPVTHVAQEETAEGVVALLQQTLSLSPSTHLFWPHSAQARSVLIDYLASAPFQSTHIDLYQTINKRPDPLPDLHAFEGVFFTSPSTVHSFFSCYSKIPAHLAFFVIGPITKAALSQYGYAGQL